MLPFFCTKTFIIVHLFKPAIITKIHSSCMTQKMKLLALFFSLLPVFLSAQIFPAQLDNMYYKIAF